ncbi:MAG: hypothetical protein E7655_08050 [Ruminococcaceae bacterium]|nr:hypothetical protein [Oscillospiraceae bacterium]
MDEERKSFTEQDLLDGKRGSFSDFCRRHNITVGGSIKFTLKALIFLFVATVYALLFWRMMTARVPAEVKRYLWTEEALALYQTSPDDFAVYKHGNGTRIVDDCGITMENGSRAMVDGSFTLEEVLYAESAKEIQFTVRYNNSTVKYLTEAYRLASAPEGEPFIYMLTDDQGKRYTEYVYAPFSKAMYNYRRILFKDVDLTDLTDLTLEIYYIGDVNPATAPYCTIPVYVADTPIRDFPEKGKYMTYTAYETFASAADPTQTEVKEYTEYILFPLEDYSLSRSIADTPYGDFRTPPSYLVKGN